MQVDTMIVDGERVELTPYKRVNYYVPRTRGDMIKSLCMFYPERERSDFNAMDMKQLTAIYHSVRAKLGR